MADEEKAFDIGAWIATAAAECRRDPNRPRPQTRIAVAVSRNGGWRLLPAPPETDLGQLGDEPAVWVLERPFQSLDGECFFVRYRTEEDFRRGAGIHGGHSFELDVTVSADGTALEFVAERRLATEPITVGDDLREQATHLLAAIKGRMSELEELWQRVCSEWVYEDPVYRYYHGSFKVYRVQDTTLAIFRALQSLEPDRYLHGAFCDIVRSGTGKVWDISHNAEWQRHTRPMLEAFFHARHMLEMIVKYGRELTEAPRVLPSGWATLLYLYGLR